MLKRAFLFLAPAVLALGLLYSARGDIAPHWARLVAAQWRTFEPDPLPVDMIQYIYDMGVVDANDDGNLDLYTANHNYRQFLFLGSGGGRMQDVLSDWKLDQSIALPGFEQSNIEPAIKRPGLYVYWLGDTLHLRFHGIEDLGPVKGKVHFFNLANVVKNEGIEVRESVSRAGLIPEMTLDISASKSGHLVLYPLSRGAPAHFRVEAPWAGSKVFVGRNAIVPQPFSGMADPPSAAQAADACAQCLEFEMTLLDRHSMAWADINRDGKPDVFINRGALGGTLRSFPKPVRDRVGDELLVSQGPGSFADRAREAGIQKKDCSGRHVRWVDFDQDGLLDLFINCQDRGHVPGGYPKQFYHQGPNLHFDDVAAKLKLDLPQAQLVDMVWFDADGDGRIDLFTHEDTGYYLYRRVDGVYQRERVHVGPFHRANTPGLTGNTTDYWQFDGKLSVMDYNADGALDVFVASKRGNVLLVNHGGKFTSVDLNSVGLPAESVAAAWVDYDNDGRMDLHLVPDGIYRQSATGRFERTGLLALPAHKYQAAIINWFDRDNDGALDVVMALEENSSLWRWWEKLYKREDVKGRDDRTDWQIVAYRNRRAGASWLELKLVGRGGNREAIGAQVTLVTGDARQARQVGSHDGAYLSQGHYRLYFGLGQLAGTVNLEIVWPDGRRQQLRDVRVNQLLTVTQAD